MRSSWATLAGGLGLAACPSPGQAPSTPPAATEPETNVPQERVGPCGGVGERLHGLGWVPAQSRLTALVELESDDLQTSLAALADLARGDTHGLPMDLAFGLAHWDFQIPLLHGILRSAGFEPAELAVLRLDEVGSAWVFASTCDLALATQRIETIWGVAVRRTATGAIGTSPPEHGFPFDVVFLPADRVALTPAGSGAALTRALATPSSSEGPHPGRVVETIEPAPIRAFVHRAGLSAGDAGDATASMRRLRASSAGVEIDGTIAPSS